MADPLGDIFGPPPGASSAPVISGPLEELDFNPDNFNPNAQPSAPTSAPAQGGLGVANEPLPSVPRQRAAGAPATALAAGATTAAAIVTSDPIDPVELKKRIQGSGSVKPGKLELVLFALKSGPAKCTEGYGRARGKFSETPRWKLIGGLIVCLVVFVGVPYWYIGRDTTTSALVASGDLIVVDKEPEAAKPKAKAKRKKTDEDDEDADDDKPAAPDKGDKDEEVKKPMSRGNGRWEEKEETPAQDARVRSNLRSSDSKSSAPSSSSWEQEVKSLRGLITEGDKSILDELKALRREVARLKTSAASGSSGDSSVETAPQDGTKASRRRRSMGEVASEDAKSKDKVTDALPPAAFSSRSAAVASSPASGFGDVSAIYSR